jgi:hypothetical protein
MAWLQVPCAQSNLKTSVLKTGPYFPPRIYMSDPTATVAWDSHLSGSGATALHMSVEDEYFSALDRQVPPLS